MSEKRKSESQETAFFGEEMCQIMSNHPGFSVSCRNKAYYRLNAGKLSCGVHSRNKPRTQLPVNPNAEEVAVNRLVEWERLVEESAAANLAAGRRGSLTVSKLKMMRAPEHVDGVRNVFPNNRHQNRKDGFGCSSLSPMRLGPTQHWQPGLPQALSIENYHQFNKVFSREVETDANGQVTVQAAFFNARNAAYLDPVPHRRKFEDEKGTNGNRNVPLFCLHLTRTGEERRYTYIESRYFYCREYERLAKQTADFAKLRDWLAQGYNLQIVGYDGHSVDKSVYELYTDERLPFGHELVLYTLLAIENPAEYPWNVYYERHRSRYE